MKRSSTLILFLLVFLFDFFQQAKAQKEKFVHTVEVCPTCQYKDLAAGIAASQDGDIVLVRQATYHHSTLVIDKKISLVAVSGAVLVHEGSGDALMVTASNVTIKGLKILGSGKSTYEDFSAIKVANVNYCQIVENEIVDSQYGIMVANSENCIVQGNNIYTKSSPVELLGDGIHLWKTHNSQVSKNNVHGHRDGIYLEFAKVGHVFENNITNNRRYGLHFMFSDENEFHDNVFSANDAGVAVMYSKKIKMYQNDFSRNAGAASFGLLLKDISDSEILENTFTANTVAIYMEGSNRNKFQLNRFDKNGWALRLLSSCEENKFEGNAFLENNLEIATNSEQSLNQFKRNYWAHHNNVDLNADGIADLPYQPTSFSSYLLEKYNVSILLMRSPLLNILDWAEKTFPALSPISLRDTQPLMSYHRKDKI